MRWHASIALLLLVLLSGCKEEKLAQGAPAPALAAFDLQGKEATLARWQGKKIYLNFWSASCGGCMAEMATLQALSQQWKDKIDVVAINTDPDSVNIDEMLTMHHITYPVLRDQLKITQERYQVIGTPTSFVIDGKGQLISMYQGARSEQALKEAFATLAQQ